jgi:hypothetical protein
LGLRVEIYWDGNKKWYKGSVDEYNDVTRKIRIRYDDGDTEWCSHLQINTHNYSLRVALA